MFRGRMERLGWIRAPRASLAQWGPLVAFADAARRDGLTRVLVCGMGGSSLTAEVVARACGGTSLQVLDSTDPAAVLEAERAAPRDRTLFLVVSKSGTTLETLAFYRYFAARARPEQFVAVTDPGTQLEALAREHRFRAVFPHPPDVGGRYAALTVVGMLPAALIGVDGRVLFFFQAEDGIRDLTVTGVQTCALPIWPGFELHGQGRTFGRFVVWAKLLEQRRERRIKRRSDADFLVHR